MASIAYFSMEVGLVADMPTYAGGLGVLAGDTLRSAADLGIPVVGVTLLHRKGYFHQRLDAKGRQSSASSRHTRPFLSVMTSFRWIWFVGSSVRIPSSHCKISAVTRAC
jgi:glucan phosphorylase